MYITNSKAVALAQQVIAEHAPLILAKLGLAEKNDGILDRITVLDTPLTKEEPSSAMFLHTVITRGFLGMDGSEYQWGSGKVEVNAASMFYFRNKKGVYKDVKFVRLVCTKKVFRKHIIFLLAHELRHYWQFLTGAIWEKSSRRGAVNFMPYEWRWEERDANEFAIKYLEEVKK